VVGKDPVKLEKYLEKKIALPEEDISTFNIMPHVVESLLTFVCVVNCLFT
jgi:hypothetical protein